MNQYWATFRIAAGPGYEERYDALLDALFEIRNSSWAEPTSFWLFDSELDLVAAAKRMAKGLNTNKDLLVVRSMNKGGVVYFGKLEHEDVLRVFFPEAKKVG